MSTVKSKNLQVGTDATASNNFTIYQPSTPDGTLRIGVGNADSPTEVARFSSNGYVPKKPYAFYAYDASTQTISNATQTKLEYDSIAYETGSTSYYNTSTYTWTAPYNGIYLVNHFVEMAAGANSIHSGIFVNGGGNTSKGFRDVWNQTGNSVNASSDNASQYNVKHANLVAGDTLEFYTYHSSGGSKNVSPSRTGVQITLITLL